jgi:hypothetical protein
MTKKLRSRSVVFLAVLAAWAASGAALAVDEVEPNDPVNAAQHLVIGTDGSVQVQGVMGVLTGTATRDVDFYSFEGSAGDVVTVDIDAGILANGTGVDTILAVFGPNGANPLYLWRQNDDAGLPLDEGSFSKFDARVTNFRLPVSGRYVVGVSSFPGSFIDVNTLSSGRISTHTDGSYTLIISGVTPSVQQINIIIKPGSTDVAPINPKAKGNVAVALLSSTEFDAMDVDQSTLRFGAQGNEASLLRCNKDGTDVNGDGLLDLVCHFDNPTAGFQVGDTEGMVTGATKGGRLFEGRGWLKVVGRK